MVIDTAKESGGSVPADELFDEVRTAWMFVNKALHVVDETSDEDKWAFCRLSLD